MKCNRVWHIVSRKQISSVKGSTANKCKAEKQTVILRTDKQTETLSKTGNDRWTGNAGDHIYSQCLYRVNHSKLDTKVTNILDQLNIGYLYLSIQK